MGHVRWFSLKLHLQKSRGCLRWQVLQVWGNCTWMESLEVRIRWVWFQGPSEWDSWLIQRPILLLPHKWTHNLFPHDSSTPIIFQQPILLVPRSLWCYQTRERILNCFFIGTFLPMKLHHRRCFPSGRLLNTPLRHDAWRCWVWVWGCLRAWKWCLWSLESCSSKLCLGRGCLRWP